MILQQRHNSPQVASLCRLCRKKQERGINDVQTYFTDLQFSARRAYCCDDISSRNLHVFVRHVQEFSGGG